MSSIGTKSFRLNNLQIPENAEPAKQPVRNAIENIFNKDEYKNELVNQLTQVFYSYVTSGREYRIIFEPGSYTNRDVVYDYSDNLKNKNIKVTSSEESEDGTMEIKFFSHELNQDNIRQALRTLKPDSIQSNMKTDGDVFTFSPR